MSHRHHTRDIEYGTMSTVLSGELDANNPDSTVRIDGTWGDVFGAGRFEGGQRLIVGDNGSVIATDIRAISGEHVVDTEDRRRITGEELSLADVIACAVAAAGIERVNFYRQGRS